MTDAAASFLELWRRFGSNKIRWVAEYKFHPARRWRFDAAHIESKVAVEIEGLKYRGKSRHTTVAGYSRDCEKYNAAIELGWRVLRYSQFDVTQKPIQILEQIERVINT